VSPDPKDPHSFRLLHGKQAIHTHAMTVNQPVLMAVSHRYDMIRIWMNKKRGEQLGLKDGDWVRIKSIVEKERFEFASQKVFIPLVSGSERIWNFLQTLKDSLRCRVIL